MSTSHFLRIFRSIIVLSIIALFVGCSGGGKDKVSSEDSFTISGSVSGAIQQGVTITLSGASSGTATTDASGNYSFPGLKNGSYTITPSMTGYTFSPASKAVTINNADVSANDFTAATSMSPTYGISGIITAGGVGKQGVAVTLSGTNSGTATTDASGNYSFTGLVNGAYTITPSLTGYTFNPASLAVMIDGANVTSENFTATANSAPTYSISGTVTKDGTALPGVTMTLSGAGTGTVSTDSSGNYTFSNLANGTYTVTPTLTLNGYTFTQASFSVTIDGANKTANFIIEPENWTGG